MLKLGTHKINDLYKGATPILKVYRGRNLVHDQITYTPLEYLQSTGSQYIDTGFIYNTNKKIEIGFSVPYIGTNACAFGSRNSGVRRGLYEVGNSMVIAGDSSWTSVGVAFPTEYTFCDVKIDTEKATYDEKDYPLTLKFTENELSFYLFALNDGGKVSGYALNGTRIYYFKAYDENSNLVLDMIPVLDKKGVACFYDKVSKKFFYNKGTGQFTAGRQIHYVDYLQSTGRQGIDTGLMPDWTQPFNIKGVFSIREQDVRHCFLGNYIYDYADGCLNIEISAANYPRIYLDYGKVNSFIYTEVENNVKNYLEFSYENITPQVIFTVNDNSVESTKILQTEPTRNMYLFRDAREDGSFQGIVIYECSISINGKLIRNFKPAIDENGVAFMFDEVQNKIYDNAGRGNFTYGLKE